MKHFTTLFLASLITFVVANDKEKHKEGGKNKHSNVTSEAKECHRLWKLTKLQETVSNATRMADLNRTHPEKAAKLVSEAASIGPELTSLTNNQTLTKFCPIVKAHDKMVHECQTLKHADKLTLKLKNATLLTMQATKQGRTEAEVKAKWQKELDEINKLKANATLAKACTKVKEEIGKNAKQHKSDASSVRLAGTGVFALGVGVYVAALLF
jgi:hypothetical protein